MQSGIQVPNGGHFSLASHYDDMVIPNYSLPCIGRFLLQHQACPGLVADENYLDLHLILKQL